MDKQPNASMPDEKESFMLLQALESIPSLRFLGWGFLLAWGTISTFTRVFAESGVGSFQTYWLTNMAFTALTLFASGLAGAKLMRPQNSMNAMRVSFALISTSTLLIIALPLAIAWLGTPLQTIAGALSGVGMALGTMSWGLYYSSLDAKEIESYTVFSVALMVLCYAFCLVVPQPIVLAFLVCLPALSLGCRALCRSQDADAPGKELEAAIFDAEDSDGKLAALGGLRGFFRIGFGVSASALCISFLWSLFSSGTVLLSESLFSISLLSGTAVAIVLALYCITFARRINLNSLYRWVIPLVVFALFLATTDNPLSLFCGSLCNFGAQMALDVLTFIYFCEASSRRRGSAHAIIGFGRFFLEGGIFLGIIVAEGFEWLLDNQDISLTSGVFFISSMLIAAAMISMTDRGRPSFSRARDEEPFQTNNPTGNGAQGTTIALNPEDVEELARVLFERKCDAVAERYRLSNREREVLSFLAEGRSLPYIRNELFISKSTTGTHVSHIYAKLNVHSKNELIELVEGTTVDRDGDCH